MKISFLIVTIAILTAPLACGNQTPTPGEAVATIPTSMEAATSTPSTETPAAEPSETPRSTPTATPRPTAAPRATPASPPTPKPTATPVPLEVWTESHWPGFALRQADVIQSYMAW